MTGIMSDFENEDGLPDGKAGFDRSMSTETLTRPVTVTNRHGLHARPCVAIVNTVRKYDAQVTIRKGNQVVDADSILDLLSLGAAQGTKLLLSASGPQAEVVIKALAQLFDVEFEVDYES
jgi:phosphotransferase system HPr (HPr) family protein